MERTTKERLNALHILLEENLPGATFYKGTDNIMVSGGEFIEGEVYIFETQGAAYKMSMYEPTGNDAGHGEQYRHIDSRTEATSFLLLRYVLDSYWGE